MTAHNEAKLEDIAPLVLMPGDPLRAKMIALNFLDDYKLVNTVRGMYAYTGFYKGVKITVMASGMGIPSIGIYSYELYKFYNVETIIRVGSAGALTKDLNLYDIVVVDAAISESTYAKEFNIDDKILYADSNIVSKFKEIAKDITICKTYSTDAFYAPCDIDNLTKQNCLVTEMEAFALFCNAKMLGKKAGAILTISDNLITKEETSSKERQESFKDMISIALDTIISL